MTSKDIFKGVTYDSLDKQVGGNHYNKMKIQLDVGGILFKTSTQTLEKYSYPPQMKATVVLHISECVHQTKTGK